MFGSIKLVTVSFFYRDVAIVLGLGVLDISHWAVVAISTRPRFRTVLMMDVTRAFHSLRMAWTQGFLTPSSASSIGVILASTILAVATSTVLAAPTTTTSPTSGVGATSSPDGCYRRVFHIGGVL